MKLVVVGSVPLTIVSSYNVELRVISAVGSFELFSSITEVMMEIHNLSMRNANWEI